MKPVVLVATAGKPDHLQVVQVATAEEPDDLQVVLGATAAKPDHLQVVLVATAAKPDHLQVVLAATAAKPDHLEVVLAGLMPDCFGVRPAASGVGSPPPASADDDSGLQSRLNLASNLLLHQLPWNGATRTTTDAVCCSVCCQCCSNKLLPSGLLVPMNCCLVRKLCRLLH